MFTKINTINYALDQLIADKIWRETKAYVTSLGNVDIMDTRLVESTIKELISCRVGLLAMEELNDCLVKTGFLTINFSSDIGFVITVGLLDDTGVYGVLVK